MNTSETGYRVQWLFRPGAGMTPRGIWLDQIPTRFAMTETQAKMVCAECQERCPRTSWRVLPPKGTVTNLRRSLTRAFNSQDAVMEAAKKGFSASLGTDRQGNLLIRMGGAR